MPSRGGGVEQGVSDAIAQYAHAVCAPTYSSLTPAQQSFLDAMAEDYPEPSAVANVAIRLGKSSSWVGRYRASLVGAQVVEPAGRGRVRYAIPMFGDWMREQVDA